jgi:hypothetical protein
MDEVNIEFLISAFIYSISSLNEVFYLRKRDQKVIGVHIFDCFLLEEDESYYSGLTKEEEHDIKEAIVASEEQRDTHVSIPRLTKGERFEIINEFIESEAAYHFKSKLHDNYKELIASGEERNLGAYVKGFTPGVVLGDLVNGLDDEEFKAKWTEFYRNKTRAKALAWLKDITT